MLIRELSFPAGIIRNKEVYRPDETTAQVSGRIIRIPAPGHTTTPAGLHIIPENNNNIPAGKNCQHMEKPIVSDALFRSLILKVAGPPTLMPRRNAT
jgi:hypothetical protein